MFDKKQRENGIDGTCRVNTHVNTWSFFQKELLKALGPTGFLSGNKSVFSLPSQAAWCARLPEVLIQSPGWGEGHGVVPAHSQH